MMEIRDNLFHIGRQGGADIDHLVCQWMAEVEPRGVQGLPLYAREAAAVEVVAEERMAEVREVDADLMRAARVKHEVDERELPVCLHGVVMRAGGLSVGRDFAQDDARQRAGNRRVDEPLRRCVLALNQCEVLAVEELAFAAARRQLVLNLRDLGDEDEAGCVAVEPVHGMVGVVLAVRSVPI